MATWAIGFAGKAGLEIVNPDGGKIKIASVAVGNMKHPDADEFAEKFLNRLGPEDTVLSPSGPNYTYLPGAHARGAKVYWIHPGHLTGIKKLGKHLLELFEKNPKAFYEYHAQNAGVSALGILVHQWLLLESQLTADGNAYSQMLRQEKEYFRFNQPDKEGWIERYVDSELRKLKAKLKKTGVVLTTEQKRDLRFGVIRNAETLYAGYFDGQAEKKAAEDLVKQRFEWTGVAELEDFYAKEAERTLKGLPENKLFDGLIGADATKIRAGVLAFMRNPLFYASAGNLASYFGGGVSEGQAHRARRGEPRKGNPKAKSMIFFCFAEKYWQNDPIGYFRQLYYAYKAHQYQYYWDLVELTQDVFKTLKMSVDDEDSDASAADVASAPANDGVDPRVLDNLVERLWNLRHLDLIAKSKPIMAAVEALRANPDETALARLFSRSPMNGLNLQMTPKRIERQTKRILGLTLITTVYYRWLAAMKQPLPLEKDFIYTDRWQYVTGRKEVPEEFDHQVVLKFYRKRAEELAKKREKPLPLINRFMFEEPDRREAFLTTLTDAERDEVVSQLSDKDQKKFRAIFPAIVAA